MKCAIIGLGLIGGSFGLATKEYFEEIAGIDKNPLHEKEALNLGIIDKIITLKEVKDFDVIILAIPIKGIIETIKEISKLPIKDNATIIDFGSTKEEIILSTPKNIRKNLVASHPMAGTEYSGPFAAIKDLYKNRVMVVCDIENSGEYQQKVAIDIFNYLEMKIKFMSAKEHDRHAAFISHMPHIVSFSLANSVLKQEDKEHIVALAAGGFKDMSRLAKSSPTMWRDIFKSNKENLLTAIQAFKEELKLAQKLIEKEEWNALKEWMENGNKLHKIM